MGTSSSRSGQNSRTGEQWSKAKHDTTSFANGTGASAKEALSSFASGMLDMYGRSSVTNGGDQISGLVATVGANLFDFISELAEKGIDEALQDHGLSELIGKPKNEIVAGIADHFCSQTGLLDEAIVQNTVLDVLTELFEIDENQDNDPDELNDKVISDNEVIDMLELFLVHYLQHIFMSELGSCIDKMQGFTAEKARQKEAEIESVLRSYVHFRVENIDITKFSWKTMQAQKLIDDSLKFVLLDIENE